MPAFSFSAPQYTAEDETRERLSLTEKERKEIERDLRGKASSSSIVPIDAYLDSEMTHALEEIRDKKEYLEAMTVCPQLVAIESCPTRFLRSEQYNVQSAAQKLVRYWKMRKNLFKDHAFVPIQTAVSLLEGQSKTQESSDNPQAASSSSSSSSAFASIHGDEEEEEEKVSKTGPALMKRDPQGRMVVGALLGGTSCADRLPSIRLFWSQIHRLLDDDDGDGGLVLVGGCGYHGGIHSFDRIQCKLLAQSLRCLPVTIKVFHVHLNTELAMVLYRSAMFFFPKPTRVRVHLHDRHTPWNIASGQPNHYRRELEQYVYCVHDKNNNNNYKNSNGSNSSSNSNWSSRRSSLSSSNHSCPGRTNDHYAVAPPRRRRSNRQVLSRSMSLRGSDHFSDRFIPKVSSRKLIVED